MAAVDLAAADHLQDHAVVVAVASSHEVALHEHLLLWLGLLRGSLPRDRHHHSSKRLPRVECSAARVWVPLWPKEPLLVLEALLLIWLCVA